MTAVVWRGHSTARAGAGMWTCGLVWWLGGGDGAGSPGEPVRACVRAAIHGDQNFLSERNGFESRFAE